MTTAEYLKNVGSIIDDIKKLAKEYYNFTDRPLGITGEIAEYETIRLLNLEIVPARQPGFDAYRPKVKKKEKIQIKGRVLQDNSEHGQRLGSINLKKEWDYILLTILNNDFNPIAIFEANRKTVEKELSKPGSKARNERGQLSVRKFKSIAKQIWTHNENK